MLTVMIKYGDSSIPFRTDFVECESVYFLDDPENRLRVRVNGDIYKDFKQVMIWNDKGKRIYTHQGHKYVEKEQ